MGEGAGEGDDLTRTPAALGRPLPDLRLGQEIVINAARHPYGSPLRGFLAPRFGLPSASCLNYDPYGASCEHAILPATPSARTYSKIPQSEELVLG